MLREPFLADQDAPRKQRHTAKRIHQRLVDEHGADVAESSVRQHVRLRKRELGFAVGEVFVPQSHTPGARSRTENRVRGAAPVGSRSRGAKEQ